MNMIKMPKTTLPSGHCERKLTPIIDAYDDEVFWNELIERFAMKEAFARNKNATPEEALELGEKYEVEFMKNGMKRIFIDWDNKMK